VLVEKREKRVETRAYEKGAKKLREREREKRARNERRKRERSKISE
jgi:hypothetical protein